MLLFVSCNKSNNKLSNEYLDAYKQFDINLAKNWLTKVRSDKNLAKGHYLIALIEMSNQNYDQALFACKNAIKYFKASSNTTYVAHTYRVVGNIYREVNMVEQSLINYEVAKKMYKNETYINELNIYIAKSYWLQRNWGEARKLAQQSLDYFNGKNDYHYAEANLIIGNVRFDYGKQEENKAYISNSIDNYVEAMINYSDSDLKAMAMNNIGRNYIYLENFNKANYYLDSAMSLQSKPKEIATLYFNKGILAKQQGDMPTAIIYLKKSIEKNDYHNYEFNESYVELISYYILNDQKDLALNTTKEFGQASNELVDWKIKLKEITINQSLESQEDINVIQLINDKLNKENLIYALAITLVLSVLTVILVFMYHRNKKEKKSIKGSNNHLNSTKGFDL